MKRGLYSLIIGLMLALITPLAGFPSMIVTLSSDGSLWQADSSNVNGTKSLLATLTGGASYIDSAYDGQYLYGLRSDGTVYRSDLSGNVSQVSLTGWSSSIAYINADSGTLYGMNGYGVADVLTIDGNVAVHITNTTITWGDLTVTDDNRIWLLNASGYAWGYAFTNGYSGKVSGNSGFVNFNSSLMGLALVSAGNELYGAVDNAGTSTYVYMTISNATDKVAVSTVIQPNIVDMAIGSSEVYYVVSNGNVQATSLIGESKTTLGTLGSDVVGIEVIIPEPATMGMFGFAGIVVLLLRRFLQS